MVKQVKQNANKRRHKQLNLPQIPAYAGDRISHVALFYDIVSIRLDPSSLIAESSAETQAAEKEES